MIDPGIQGETVLVTGTNNPEGIGASVARAFAAQGAQVFMSFLRSGFKGGAAMSDGYIPEAPGFDRYAWLQSVGPEILMEEIRAEGGLVEALEADLSDPSSARAVFDRAEERMGPVRILVNTAAHWTPDTFLPTDVEHITTDSHDRHMSVNSRGLSLLISEFAQRHASRDDEWGRIIQVSTDGSSGHAGAVSYGASKHASESLVRAAAWELGPFGVTANVISPGPVQTGWLNEELEASLSARLPLRRVGTPDDVADAAVFLASRQAGWITGQVLYVGGGNVMPL